MRLLAVVGTLALVAYAGCGTDHEVEVQTPVDGLTLTVPADPGREELIPVVLGSVYEQTDFDPDYESCMLERAEGIPRREVDRLSDLPEGKRHRAALALASRHADECARISGKVLRVDPSPVTMNYVRWALREATELELADLNVPGWVRRCVLREFEEESDRTLVRVFNGGVEEIEKWGERVGSRCSP